MKLKMVLATLVFGMAFCSSGYGFDLLNRMTARSGCDGGATSCCDTPTDCGGCDSGSSCGGGQLFRCHSFGNFFNRGSGGCGGCGAVDAGCGCNDGGCGGCGAVDAGCGVNGGGCGSGCGGGLFSGGLFSRRGGRRGGCGGCGSVDAGCGCNDGGCGGCGGTYQNGTVPTEAAPEGGVIEPEVSGNAPIVDPNAFIVPNRRVAGGAR